jgi:16S rRNA processing protein RimM
LVRSQNPDDANPEEVSVAVIVGTWGIKGHVKAKRFGITDDIFNPGSKLSCENREFVIQDVHAKPSQNNDVLVIKFESINNVDSAYSLKGKELKVQSFTLKDLPDWNYYHYELIGLNVLSVDGKPIGTLKKIIETGANDVYVVISSEGDEILFPAIRDVILDVNVENKFLIAQPQNII